MAPGRAYWGERQPSSTLNSPHRILLALGAFQPAPLTPNTSLPPHTGAWKEGSHPLTGWLSFCHLPGVVSPVLLSPLSPRRGTRTAPREDEAETMTHPQGGESGCAR